MNCVMNLAQSPIKLGFVQAEFGLRLRYLTSGWDQADLSLAQPGLIDSPSQTNYLPS